MIARSFFLLIVVVCLGGFVSYEAGCAPAPPAMMYESLSPSAAKVMEYDICHMKSQAAPGILIECGESQDLNIRLVEMKQTEGSVQYRSSPPTGLQQQRYREEQDKIDRSWDMLRNMVIDGRNPRPGPPVPPPKSNSLP